MVAAATVSGSAFSILGTRLVLGRFFSPEEDRATGAHPVVVLSHAFWERSFGADPSILGRTLPINRHPFTVIGVAEEGFHGHLPLHDFTLFIPIAMMEVVTGRSLPEASALTVGRLAPGSSLSRVRSAAESVAEELRNVSPGEWSSSVFVVEPHTRSFQEFRGPITLFLSFFLALSACILIISCANLAGVLLSRALARSPEMPVRLAVGAGRGRLVYQLLTETLLLFALGGGVGVVVAIWATSALGRMQLPVGVPLAGDYTPDLRIMGISMGVTLVAGLVVGLGPALRATRRDVASVLRDDRVTAPNPQRLRKASMVAQVAGAAVLLGGTGVLFRAPERAGSMDLGFEPQGIHVATVNLGIQRYSEEDGRVFLSRLLEGASKLPGVQSAALSDFVFLASPPERAGTFSTPGGDATVVAGIVGVSPRLFSTLRMEVLEGRPFDATDVGGSEAVAMVNETVARSPWPGEAAVGKTLQAGGSVLRVVGPCRKHQVPFHRRDAPGGSLPTSAPALRSQDLSSRQGPGGVAGRGQGGAGAGGTLDPQIPLSSNDSYPRLVGG